MSMTEEQLNKLEFVIIDEVYTFTNKEIASINVKLKGTKVKVIALGDPSQIMAEKESVLQNTSFSQG